MNADTRAEGGRAADGGAVDEGAVPTAAQRSFRVRLARSGREFVVPPDRSIAHVLQQHGVALATSCEQGVCGTCRTTYLEGAPEHNDFVLTPEEQEREVMPCCARCNSELLVLDL